MLSVATNVLMQAPMLTPRTALIVLPGLTEFHIPAVPAIASEFGWAVETATDLRHAVGIHADRGAAAVFFHREAFGQQCSWVDALSLLAAALPGARLIPCHGFSEQVDWDELSDAGAFHFLWLPLKENELRQCLGFVWQMMQQLPEPVLTMDEAATTAPVKRFPARSLPTPVPVRKLSYSAA
jgi:hypothetical protein